MSAQNSIINLAYETVNELASAIREHEQARWYDCACGALICPPDSEFGNVILAEWRKEHARHTNQSGGDS